MSNDDGFEVYHLKRQVRLKTDVDEIQTFVTIVD